jgi:hypothetical protein
MAIGWLYLYSRHRKAQRRLRDIELQCEEAGEICTNCGYPRYKHSEDLRETCPTYFSEVSR